MSDITQKPTTTPDEMVREVLKSYTDAALEVGIDADFLALRGKQELNARYRKIEKVPGRLEEGEKLPKNCRVIGVFKDHEGKPTTLVEVVGPDFPIRQRAREGHNKLFGHILEPVHIKEQHQHIHFHTTIPEPDPPPDEDDPSVCISGAETLVE
jgi:hypothetical protein